MNEPFYAGQEFEYKGIHYRIRSGDRCDGDLVLEFYVTGWHRPAIAHTYILTSFKYQVEENNYGDNGKVKRGLGGWYLLKKIRMACLNGWKAEAEEIVRQRADLNGRKHTENPP
jgi:hypothetical protein